MTQPLAYPLSWPVGRPRTDRNRIVHSNFGERSISTAVSEILRQLNLMSAREIVVSTNLQLRADGLPKSNQAQPADRGVAVYFKLRTGYDQQAKREIIVDRVISCDRWLLVEDNLWAIAKDIDATRGKLRWGASTVEQAFAGYAALPPAGASKARAWWDVLGLNANILSLDKVGATALINDMYRAKAREAHPDAGGSDEAMTQLNVARDEGLRAIGVR